MFQKSLYRKIKQYAYTFFSKSRCFCDNLKNEQMYWDHHHDIPVDRVLYKKRVFNLGESEI